MMTKQLSVPVNSPKYEIIDDPVACAAWDLAVLTELQQSLRYADVYAVAIILTPNTRALLKELIEPSILTTQAILAAFKRLKEKEKVENEKE